MNVVTPKLNMGNCRLHTYGTLEMAEVPRLPNVISVTPNELMTTPRAKNAKRCGMLFIWYDSSSSVSWCLRFAALPPGGARPGTYEKQTSRQTGHPDINCLIFAHTPPPAFPASSCIFPHHPRSHACLPSQSEPPRPSAQPDPRNRRREYNVAETKGDHVLLAALGVLTGIVTPLQTAVNARLRGTLGTPFRASLVSFTVGLAATTIAALLIGQVTGGL